MKIAYIVPAHYHPKAKAYMRLIIRTLNEDPDSLKADAAALQLLGDRFNTYTLAQEILLKEGIILEDKDPENPTLPGMELKGINKARNIRPHPALKIASDCHNQITKLLIEFNLTPKSRKGPNLDIEKDDPIVFAPIDRFIPTNLEIRRNG